MGCEHFDTFSHDKEFDLFSEGGKAPVGAGRLDM